QGRRARSRRRRLHHQAVLHQGARGAHTRAAEAQEAAPRTGTSRDRRAADRSGGAPRERQWTAAVARSDRIPPAALLHDAPQPGLHAHPADGRDLGRPGDHRGAHRRRAYPQAAPGAFAQRPRRVDRDGARTGIRAAHRADRGRQGMSATVLSALLGLLVVVLGALLWRERREFNKLRRWASQPRLSDPPEAGGGWGEVFTMLHRHRRSTLRRRRQLAQLIVRSRRGAQALPYGVAILDAKYRLALGKTATRQPLRLAHPRQRAP